MFEYSIADVQMQLDALPAFLRAWFAWMGLVVVVMPFAYLNHRQGRVAAWAAAIFVPGVTVLLFASGISYLIAFWHLAVWIPLLAYLARELHLGRIRPGSPLGVWALLAVFTLTVSLVLDLRDAVRWLAGERGVMAWQPGVFLPWLTIPALVAAVVLVGWYVLFPRHGRSGQD